VYLKSSLTGEEPTDIQRYASKQPAFPHQSTADQWFDETQFESYRALGEHIAETVFRPGLAPRRELGPDTADTEALFLALRQRWFPPSSQVKTSFTQQTTALSRIIDVIRSEPKLAFLEAQFFPEWNTLRGVHPDQDLDLPTDIEALRQGFHLCCELIQVMENAYLDLDLEGEAAHPDNRGWINLFRHWSWSTMFRVTWAVLASTYGARFQAWCERVLDMKLGSVKATRIDLGGAGLRGWLRGTQAETRLTFLERDLVTQILDLFDGPPREPRAQLTEIVGFDLVVEKATALRTEDSQSAACFPIGIALLGDGALHYFRIQDHLRQTGFGRDALRALQTLQTQEHKATLELAPDEVRQTLARAKLREPIGPRGMAVFERLVESVRFEQNGKG
jgi:hypothetical protein